MQIVDIHIHRCGRLENWSLEGLDAGLNVICGPNGSGKTTLLRFVSGLLSGSDPPGGDRRSGREASFGAARVLWRGRYASLSRRVRPGHAATRMICSREDAAFNDELRRCWDRLASVAPATMLLSVLSSRELQTDQLAAGLTRCRRLLTDLQTSHDSPDGPSTPAARKQELLTACTAAEQHLEQSRLHAASARRSQQRRLNESESRLQRLDTRIAEVQVQVDLLDGDRQSVVTDLRECEDRIWNATADRAAWRIISNARSLRHNSSCETCWRGERQARWRNLMGSGIRSTSRRPIDACSLPVKTVHWHNSVGCGTGWHLVRRGRQR